MLIIDGKYTCNAFDSYHNGGYTLASVREKWPGNKGESQQKHRGSLSLTPYGAPLTMIDGSGWLGAFLLTLAYGLVWFRPGFSRGNAYALMNILGCSFLIANTAWHRAWPSALTNVIWGVIAICGLLRTVAM